MSARSRKKGRNRNRRASVGTVRFYATRIVLPALALGIGLGGSRVIPPSDEAASGTEAPLAPVHLDRYLLTPNDTADRDSALALLRSAVRARDAGDLKQATSRFERVAEVLPAFADWARLLAADAAGRDGSVGEVRRLLAATDEALARDRGWRSLVRAYRVSKDYRGAAQAAAAARPRPAGERVDAIVTRGELLLLIGDEAGAREAFRAAADTFPGATRTVDAMRALSAMSGLTLDDRRRIGSVYLRHGNLDRGLSNLDAYLDGRGGTPDTRNALRLEIGRTLFARGENRRAEQRMLWLAQLQIAPELAAEALLIAGRAQYRAGRETQARATLERAVERAGGTGPIAAEALFVLGDIAHDDGRTSAARDFYRRAAAAAPESPRGHEAALRYGALHYLAGDALAAATAFTGTPGEGSRRQRLDFWAALAHRATGDSATAKRLLDTVLSLNPLSYYGMRAAELLGAPTPKIPVSANDDAQTPLRAQNALLRYELLTELGLNDAASYEIDRLLEEYAGQNGVLYGVAEALHAKGEHLRAVLIGRAIERNLEQNGNKPDARLLRIINPFPYRDLIEREAKRHGLDPYFVVALIRQESLFNPKAKSGAGAVGLMQVMPRTGRAVATRLGIRNFRDEMLTDPEINIRIGTAILADHLRNYGGRVEDVLIAYNAGAGRLGRWRSFPERADRDLFIERIPYDETRDYVRIVRTNTYVYRTLYSQ